MWGLVSFLFIGLIAGLLARFLVPGKDPMGVLGTILLGIVGSFVGGFIGALFDRDTNIFDFTTAGLFGSIIGAIIALLIYRRMQARG